MTEIAVVEGDGIGKEVIPVAVESLKILRPDLDFFPVTVGYERWKITGTAISDEDITLLKRADAILFGAVTTPPFKEYYSVVIKIRKSLDLYANVRPVKTDNVDIIIVRENTEGLYSGIEWEEEDRSCTLRVITRKGATRIARFACNIVSSRKLLTIGHKANVMKSDYFFLTICRNMAGSMNVPVNDQFIDSLALNLLLQPRKYDVILTTNMFGDILSDIAAFHTNGLGMTPSANIGDNHALFEPVHGSAPDIAGKGIANPVAALRSAVLMLEYLKDFESAKKLDSAIGHTISSGVKTPDIGGNATTDSFAHSLLKELS